MEYKEALEYIDGTKWFGAEPTLRRIKELLEKLGEPQRRLKFVHIAGTNGKGSAAAMMASVLKASGYKTGLFTSPYLFRFNERMQINGKEIDNDALALYVSAVREQADAMEEHPTQFELMTAAALLYFAAEGCDIAVLEAGLGGRYDATNVIEAPECSIIMNIGLDHMVVLGDTVETIAFEKAGIIKKNCPCILYQQESVQSIIAARCAELGSELHTADFSCIEPGFDSLFGQSFAYKGKTYALPLLGAHQLKNAAVALEATAVLRKRGWKLASEDVEHGLYSVSWPARFELCATEPDFIVDGGHNPQCAAAVKDCLMHYYPDKRRVLLVGVMTDKDSAGIMDALSDAADEFVAVTPDSPRALSAQALSELLEKYGKPVTVCESIESGIDTAKTLAGEDGMVCAVGSLFLAGTVRYYLGMY